MFMAPVIAAGTGLALDSPRRDARAGWSGPETGGLNSAGPMTLTPESRPAWCEIDAPWGAFGWGERFTVPTTHLPTD